MKITFAALAIASASLMPLNAFAGDLFYNGIDYVNVPGVGCTESDSTGCTTGPISAGSVGGVFTVNLGSDGEQHFDPFGYGADTSDGIQFTNLGNVTITNNSAFGWTNQLAAGGGPIGDGNTWVLPSDLSAFGCGVENTTTCEPVGVFTLNTPWGFAPGTGQYFTFLDSDGITVSDTILLDDAGGPGGNLGQIQFFSDPASPISSTPEPGTAALMLGALGVAGYYVRRRRAA